MADTIHNLDAEEHHSSMAHTQDKIGWRTFMEGLISKDMVICQDVYQAQHDRGWGTSRWTTGLVTKLLEVTQVNGCIGI